MPHHRTLPSSSLNIPPSVWDGLDRENIQRLDVPANRLRKHLEIPDITTRSGLKKVHADFDRFSQCLDECYVTALSQGNTTDAMLVCIIWTQMATDVLLRKQLMSAGLIPKIIPLFGLPPAGGVAEELMKVIIRSTDGANTEEFALEIFRHSLSIVRIMQAHLDDADVVNRTIRTLARGFLETILDYRLSHPSIFDDPSRLVPVLSALLDTLRTPPEVLTKATLYVAIIILEKAPPACPPHCRIKDIPSLLAYYAALSRSHHLRARCNAVTVVRHFAFAELKPALNPDEDVQHTLVPFGANMSGGPYTTEEELLAVFPEDLRSMMLRYSAGADTCECIAQFRSHSEAASALSQYSRDNDLCMLGLRLAELLQLAESIIDPDADFDLPPHRHTSDNTQPKQLDILPLCAAALEDRRQDSAAQDAADVLRLYHLLATNGDIDIAEVHLRARQAMQRNANLPYAHYAHAMSVSLSAADIVLKLRTLRDAMGCAGQTPALQRRLVCRAVQVAAEHACSILRGVSSSSSREPERRAAAYFRQAVDAADTYFRLAPPDARQLPMVLSWYLILKLIFEPPRRRADLSRYEPLLERIRTAERFAEILHGQMTKKPIQLAREWLFEEYRSGSIRQWDPLVERLGEMADDVTELVNASPPVVSFASATANRVRLDQCSWCKNATVSLKKCSRCKEARYCSTTCQKAHWPQHKGPCQKAAAAPA